MASMSPSVAMSGTAKERNRSTVSSANSTDASILSASSRYSPADSSCVKPPTTAVMGWMLRPPTFVHSSLPSAFRPSAFCSSSGSVSASGKTLFVPMKSGVANTNRCDAWFCRYDPYTKSSRKAFVRSVGCTPKTPSMALRSVTTWLAEQMPQMREAM